MLVAGRSNKEIGAPLGIAEHTIKAHVAKLMRKVGVQNRIGIAKRRYHINSRTVGKQEMRIWAVELRFGR